MTPGHQADRAVLLQALRSPATYIGCIGSRSKADSLNASEVVTASACVKALALCNTVVCSDGLNKLGEILCTNLRADIGKLCPILHEECDLVEVSRLKLLVGLVVVEVSGCKSDLVSRLVEAVCTVVHSELKNLDKAERTVLASEIALPGNLDLLAPKAGVISCILDRNLVLVRKGVDDKSIGNDRRITHSLGPKLDRKRDKRIRSFIAYTKRHSRVRIVEVAENVESDVGKIVACVLAVLGQDTADRDVVDTMLEELHHHRCDKLVGSGLILFLRLLIEGIHILVEASYAVHPIPEAVEPCKLLSLVKSLGLVDRDAAAVCGDLLISRLILAGALRRKAISLAGIKQAVLCKSFDDYAACRKHGGIAVLLDALVDLFEKSGNAAAQQLLIAGNRMSLISAGPPESGKSRMVCGNTENFGLTLIHIADIAGVKFVTHFVETCAYLVRSVLIYIGIQDPLVELDTVGKMLLHKATGARNSDKKLAVVYHGKSLKP